MSFGRPPEYKMHVAMFDLFSISNTFFVQQILETRFYILSDDKSICTKKKFVATFPCTLSTGSTYIAPQIGCICRIYHAIMLILCPVYRILR